MKKFYTSQKLFIEWREKNYTDSNLCIYQVHDKNILIEKWELSNTIAIVEIFPNGNGFQIYWPV